MPLNESGRKPLYSGMQRLIEEYHNADASNKAAAKTAMTAELIATLIRLTEELDEYRIDINKKCGRVEINHHRHRGTVTEIVKSYITEAVCGAGNTPSKDEAMEINSIYCNVEFEMERDDFSAFRRSVRKSLTYLAPELTIFYLTLQLKNLGADQSFIDYIAQKNIYTNEMGREPTHSLSRYRPSNNQLSTINYGTFIYTDVSAPTITNSLSSNTSHDSSSSLSSNTSYVAALNRPSTNLGNVMSQ